MEKGREDPDNSEQESPAVEEGNVESDVVEEPSHPEIGGANPEQDIGTEVNADKTPTAPTISLTADFPLLAPRPTVAVNQGLLEDAMSDNEPDHTLGDTTHDEPFSEGSANPSTSDVSVITSDDSIFTKDAETVPISSSPSSQVSNGPEIAPPPNPPFNTLWIHIDEEDGPEFEGHSEKDEAKVIRTTRRKVLYMTVSLLFIRPCFLADSAAGSRETGWFLLSSCLFRIQTRKIIHLTKRSFRGLMSLITRSTIF